MAKTKKQIQEDLKLVDVIIEILDARIPFSSRNPEMEEILKGKTKIYLLNKADLADEEITKKWKKHFEEAGIKTIITDSNTGKGISEVIQELEKMRAKQNATLEEKGRIGKAIRTMVIGIPNVGKSSFINRISKKTSAQVGNKPGVTKQKQWIRVNQNIELLDTPGVLWPKLDQEKVGLHLAYIGSIKDEILSTIDIGYQLVMQLQKEYPEELKNRYHIDLEKIEQSGTEEEETDFVIKCMNEIGKKRGALVSGGEVDLEKVANLVIDDFRKGKIGRLSIEKPN